MKTECTDPKGHLFKDLPEPKTVTQFSCCTCGEVREFDPLTKSWKIVEKRKP